MKKISIVGRGTAGALGALHFNHFLDKSKFEIEWLFDDSIPTQSVGEGSTLQLPTSLFDTSGFNHSMLPKLGGSVKTGIYKSGWGKGDEFYHDFPRTNVAYHFQAGMLHQYGLEYLTDKVSINDTHVGNIDNVDADFVFDCSGRPKDYGDDFVMSDMVVNTARVWQCPWDFPRFNHTLTIARPYGWVFGIPLSNRLSIGYIYNRDYATPEMIEDDIKNVFEKYDIEPGEDGNYIEFDSYYRKNNFDGRVGYSGNSSFFLEPLEATSTATMDKCQRGMFDMIMGDEHATTLNANYTNVLEQTEDMIMTHYYAGSTWNTEFWKHAKEKATQRLETSKDNPLFKQIMTEGLNYKRQSLQAYNLEYGTWEASNFALHFDKLGITNRIRDLLNE